MNKNACLYYASTFLLEAAKLLREVNEEKRVEILDIANELVSDIKITGDDKKISQEIDEFMKIIKGEE